jgi:glyoxylase-like metal-dependent hydrolase (beta-lactamase superfamily II)
MTQITTLRLPICNVYLLRGTRAVLVDAGRPSDAGRLRDLLHKEGVAVEDLALILHTHAHWDHCGSTRQLKQWTKAPIAVHRADADMMRRGYTGNLKPIGWTAWLLKPILDLKFPGVGPDILVDHGTDLSPFGVEARIVATPGHTAGSITVLTPEGDAIVGDLVMGGYWGGRLLPGRPNYHYFAEDFDLLKASISDLMETWRPQRILPGHGGPLDPKATARLGVGGTT